MASRLRKALRRRAEAFGTHLVRPNQQAHQLRAVTREVRVCSATGNYVTSEIRTLCRSVFHVSYLRLRNAFVSWFNSQRNTRTRERNFPRRSTSFSTCEHPRI